MGEVYRAKHSRLDREVAIKIVPEPFACDPDRLARFEREAKAVAALSDASRIWLRARPLCGRIGSQRQRDLN